ncbi:MAG: Flp pilus assembly protein CpaB [Planctomycetaceae bacterium]
MKFKSVLLLAVAVGCGLVAMLGVRQVLSGPTEKTTESVLVAKLEIQAGVPLDETNVGFKDMPIDLIPEGAVTSWEDITDRALRQGAFPDDVITVAKLGEKGYGNASSKIPKGWRVVTVPVDLTKTHSGLILPGDRVDLQLTYKSNNLGSGGRMTPLTHTKTFLEFIEVFATDSVRSMEKTVDSEIKSKNISLLVTPEQANLVQLAQSEGQVNLILRNKDDKDAAKAQSADSTLFGDVRVGYGRRVEEELEKPVPAPTPPTNVQAFLDDNTEPVAAPPEKPIWKLRILEGTEEKIEEIEYEEETELALAPATSAEGDAHDDGGSPISWKNLFRMIDKSRGGADQNSPAAASASAVSNGPAASADTQGETTKH